MSSRNKNKARPKPISAPPQSAAVPVTKGPETAPSAPVTTLATDASALKEAPSTTGASAANAANAPSEPSLRDRLHGAFANVRADKLEALHALLEMYDENVRFEDPIQVVEGRGAFLETNRRLLSRSKELEFFVGPAVGTDEQFFMTWTMRMKPRVGPEFRVDGVTHIRSENGKVVYHRDFWDIAAMFASAIPGGPSALRALLKPLT